MLSNRTATGNKVVKVAGEALAFGEVVYFKSDGKAWRADADGSSTFPAMAMSLGTVAAGNSGTFLVQGNVRNDSWSWTIGGTVYLSTTVGAMTQTAPTTAGNIVQVLGVAHPNADTIFFSPQLTYTSVPVSAVFVVVAGGGGGGNGGGGSYMGGGGAGGMVDNTTLSLTKFEYYTVTVGAGGADHTTGSNSVCSSITAYGGGQGAAWNQTSGLSGGSGGGGDLYADPAGTGVATQGNAGGLGDASDGSGGGGGGGGAGATGGTAATSGGSGGAGYSSLVNGTTYAGGAGGAGWPGGTGGGSGGSGGGGNGGSYQGTAGTAGTANTGGGAGGGAAGGSGVVIIKIVDSLTLAFSGGVTYSGGSPSGGYRTYTITATSTSSETFTCS